MGDLRDSYTRRLLELKERIRFSYAQSLWISLRIEGNDMA